MAAVALATGRFPDNYNLQLNFGITLLRASDFVRAAHQFERTILLDPDYPSGHFLLAAAWKQQSNNIAAILSGARFQMLESGTRRSREGARQLLALLDQDLSVRPDGACRWLFRKKAWTAPTAWSNSELAWPCLPHR